MRQPVALPAESERSCRPAEVLCVWKGRRERPGGREDAGAALVVGGSVGRSLPQEPWVP